MNLCKAFAKELKHPERNCSLVFLPTLAVLKFILFSIVCLAIIINYRFQALK